MSSENPVYWLILFQWVAHFLDEWFFGFPEWATRHFGVLPEDFWLKGMVVLTALVGLVSWGASRERAHAGWLLIVAGLQMVFLSNGLFHGILSAWYGEYSPGTATGLLLYLPLSGPVWKAVLRDPRVSRRGFVVALAVGFLVHALVLASLPLDKGV